MSSFDNREKAYENEYAYRLERDFQVQMRRNKLLGLWAADQMGFSAEAAKQYALDLIDVDLQQPGDKEVFQKLRDDLHNHGVKLSDHRLEKKMTELAQQAKDQLAG